MQAAQAEVVQPEPHCRVEDGALRVRVEREAQSLALAALKRSTGQPLE